MGSDLTCKAAKPFQKGLDRSLQKLNTPHLFTQQPNCKPRAYAAKVSPNEKLLPDEKVGIRLQDGKVVASKRMDIVAEFCSPPKELINTLENECGESYGIVQQVYESANVAEISVC